MRSISQDSENRRDGARRRKKAGWDGARTACAEKQILFVGNVSREGKRAARSLARGLIELLGPAGVLVALKRLNPFPRTKIHAEITLIPLRCVGGRQSDARASSLDDSPLSRA